MQYEFAFARHCQQMLEDIRQTHGDIRRILEDQLMRVAALKLDGVGGTSVLLA